MLNTILWLERSLWGVDIWFNTYSNIILDTAMSFEALTRFATTLLTYAGYGYVQHEGMAYHVVRTSGYP